MGLAARGYQDALDLVEMLGASRRDVPFPVPVLEELRRLTNTETVGYVELGADVECGDRATVTRVNPPWLFENLAIAGQDDPTHRSYTSIPAEPIAISDFMTRREFQRTRIYDVVCGPLGVEDSLRVYLPAHGATTRFFFFDSPRRGFGSRTRLILETLRPHLTQARDRWTPIVVPAQDQTVTLTRREHDVLSLVDHGLTNRQIARQLWMTEHTVRKHLENSFRKLSVHNRTAAVAALRRIQLEVGG